MDPFWCGAAIVTVLVCSCALADLRRGRIPNALTLGALALGIAVHGSVPGTGGGVVFALAGAAAGGGLFIVPFALGGMGGGDVKLMAAVGAWVGPSAVLWVALFAALAGGALALVHLAWRRSGVCLGRIPADVAALLASGRPASRVSGSRTLPYAPAVALGWFAFLAWRGGPT